MRLERGACLPGSHDTFFPEIADHATESHEGNLAPCQAVWVELNPARLQGSHCLTMGWVRQQRPLGTVASQGRDHEKVRAAHRDCQAGKGVTKKAGKRATPPGQPTWLPGLCCFRQYSSKNLGLSHQRLARRVRIPNR